MTDREKLISLMEDKVRDITCWGGETLYLLNPEKLADHLVANGVVVQKPIRKAEDCRCYTKTTYGGACLGTKEIDPCKGPTCERWRRREK